MNVILINSGSVGNDHTGNSLRSGSAIINYDFILLDTSASVAAESSTLLTTSASQAALTNSLLINEARKWMPGWAWDSFEDYPLGTITTLNKGFGWTNTGTCSTGSSIITRSFNRGQTVEKLLALSTAQFGRKLPFGDSWQRMIIAVMMRTQNVAPQMTVDGKIGVCSGTTNMVASSTCDNFFGWEWCDGTVNTATFSSGSNFASGSGNYRLNPAPRFLTKRGSTVTDRGSGAGTAGNILAGNLANTSSLGFYSVLVMDLQRPIFVNDSSSITYNQAFRMTETGSVEFTVGKSYMFDILTENPAAASLGGFGTVLLNTVAQGLGGITLMTGFSFDQSTGKFDTLNVSWQHSSSLEIAAIAVKKLF